MKRLLCVLLVITVLFSFTGCLQKSEPAVVTTAPPPSTTVDNSIAIPDVSGTDEAVAKNILSYNGIIPAIVYEYSDTVEKGYVTKTEPAIGTRVQPNSKITVYISQGPAYIDSGDSVIRYRNLTDKNDSWNFASPYIYMDTLYINCRVTFQTSMSWKDEQNKGIIFGFASVTDTFNKKVPVSAKYEKKTWLANEEQTFTLEIPLGDLDTDKPTDLYIKLIAYDGLIPLDNKEIEIDVSFIITW